MQKLPISAMIVGYNEAHFLEQCFESISFCDEIIYTDLGSTDNSLIIAKKYAQQIHHRKKVNIPSCEMVQTEVVHFTKNDWVIFIDPDEMVSPSLANQIMEELETIKSDLSIGSIMVPWQFYYKKKKLKGTVWGGINKKYFLVNKYRFEFLPIVHFGRRLKEGFQNYEIAFDTNKNNILHHYWMNSFKVFINKHLRYLKREGIDNYNAGKRMGKKELLFSPFNAFSNSFFKMKGYKDGFVGLFLSGFWAFYKTKIGIDIYILQSREKKKLTN
jgi:glycosyltransferase involved in cell wall biosynthesis